MNNFTPMELAKDIADAARQGVIMNFPSPEVARLVQELLTPKEWDAYWDEREAIAARALRVRDNQERNHEALKEEWEALKARYGEERARWFSDDDPEVLAMRAELQAKRNN